MKRSAFFALAIFLLAVSNYATAAGTKGKYLYTGERKIYNTIPFVLGADQCTQSRTYSKSKMEHIREYADIAKDLMTAGAKGLEAGVLIALFGQLYERDRADSLGGFNWTFEESLKASLDLLYQQNPVKERKVSFRYVNSTDNITVAKLGVNYVAYGHYSIARDCRTFNLTLNMFNIINGDQNSFFGSGTTVEEAAYSLASNIFFQLQRTRFPVTIKVAGKNLTLLNYPDYKAAWDIARDICIDLGGRLPTYREVRFIKSRGDFNDGITLDIHNNYVLFEDNSVFVAGFQAGQEKQRFSMVNDLEAHYFCVRD